MTERTSTPLHTDRGYEADLRAMRARLLRMAGRVEVMIERSVAALTVRDTDAARATIALDAEVNRDEMDLDAACLELLARRQPMASDLRFITLTMKMVTDLERIADLAVNICERAIDLNDSPPPPSPYVDIPRMELAARTMVRDAIDAFVERDLGKAEAVIARDDEVDDLYRGVFRHLLALMQEGTIPVGDGIHIQSVAKYLERMGDHATNLAEQAIFMLRATDVRHQGKLGRG